MSKRLFAVLTAVLAVTLSMRVLANVPEKSPILVVLYTQISDFTHMQFARERIQRSLPALQSFRDKYPKYSPSAIYQFSGASAEELAATEKQLPLIQRLKEYASRGTIELGYCGEPEPTYHHRPQANLVLARTPEERWAARAEAGERFLSDYKNPLTGEPFPGLSGGLKRTQEIFGTVAYISGLNPIDRDFGGDSPQINQLRKYNRDAVILGFPNPNPERAISEYGNGASGFSSRMTPAADISPELYFEDNYLRSSEFTSSGVRAFSTEQGVDALKKAFDQIDRTHVRVIHIEYNGYNRYLNKRPDGVVKYDPLDWAYNRPDNPTMPVTLSAFAQPQAVYDGYKNDESVLRWLVEDFFPANPGSRFVSTSDLKRVTQSPLGNEFSAAELHELAADLRARYAELLTSPPNFAKAGNHYFSLADSFELLAISLADFARHGSLPDKVKLGNIYGPMLVKGGMGPVGEVTVGDVETAAAKFASRLQDDSWKALPENVVPWQIILGKLQLNPAQFLRLMAEAYLDPRSDRKLEIKQSGPLSLAAGVFPKNIREVDQGNAWTYRPAPLRMEQLQ